MRYQPKIVKCRLKTGGKSIEDIQKQYKIDADGGVDDKLSHQECEHMRLGFEEFDGVELYLSLWDYDDYADYHLHDWEKEQDKKVMMGVYYFEQVNPLAMYIDELPEFMKDWESGEYDASGVLCFDRQDVEEIEVIQEERK